MADQPNTAGERDDTLAAYRREIDRLRAENAKLAMMSRDCANRTATTSLGFLAKIARDLGFENRKQESNAEMIGRALRDLHARGQVGKEVW
jgi:hypothetical protein